DAIRRAALSSRASEFDRSQSRRGVLSEAVRPVGDQDDVQRIRGGEDRKHFLAIHESPDGAAKRADRTPDLVVALRLEHAKLEAIRRELPQDGFDDRADGGRSRRQAGGYVE